MKWPELMCVMAFGGGGNDDTPKEWHTVLCFSVTVYPCGAAQPQKGFSFMEELQIMQGDFAL